MLTENEKELLRGIVRRALETAVRGGEFTPDAPSKTEYPALHAACGCFVTYKTVGELRGCIGCFVARQPLYLTVAEYARASALEDPRFADNRLRPAELAQVAFDISVLSPLQKCVAPEKIVLGRDGIYVTAAGRSGCFLPQVATETGWSVEEFWGSCCAHKAGLPYDFWKNPAAELYTFTAEVVEGKYEQ